MAVWTGLEPATSCVTGRHSNQLNYQTNHKKYYMHEKYIKIHCKYWLHFQYSIAT